MRALDLGDGHTVSLDPSDEVLMRLLESRSNPW
jgi:hypothetical protein